MNYFTSLFFSKKTKTEKNCPLTGDSCIIQGSYGQELRIEGYVLHASQMALRNSNIKITSNYITLY